MFYVFTRDYIPFYDKENNRVDFNVRAGAVQSTVNIEGKRVVDLQCRDSLSIRDSFETNVDLSVYIPNYKIATGHKHIYGPGQFMESHYDSEKTPIDDKKHIATLIVICPGSFTGGDLIIEGNLIEYDKSVFTCVLMSIKCMHKVDRVLTGERHSFVFPVYGEFNFDLGFSKYYGCRELTTIYDQTLEHIATFDGSAEAAAKLQGYVKMLDDYECTGIANKIRKLKDKDCYAEYDNMYESDYEELDDDDFYTEVTYTFNGTVQKIELYPFNMTTYQIPDGSTNIIIKGTDYTEFLLDKLKRRMKVFKGNYKYYYEKMTQPKANIEQIDQMLQVVDKQLPIIIYLSGRYDKDATIEKLSVSDKSLFDYLINHYEFTFYSAINFRHTPLISFNYRQGNLYYKKEDGDEKMSAAPDTIPTILFTHLDVEFNDDDGYDPVYTLGSSAFLLTKKKEAFDD